MKKFLGLSLLLMGLVGAGASHGNQFVLLIGVVVAIAGLLLTWSGER